MNRRETMEALSTTFAPARVWSHTDSWTFCIETSPATIFTISEVWANDAAATDLSTLVAGTVPGEYLLNFRGDLVPFKGAATRRAGS